MKHMQFAFWIRAELSVLLLTMGLFFESYHGLGRWDKSSSAAENPSVCAMDQ